jgi:cyanate lyase
MRREQLTEKILDIKRRQGWSWRHITEGIGGVSPILIVGALLGQMKLVKPLAKKAAGLFGLSEEEERMLNEVPMRGTPMPPTDPLLYRFYELVMVNGPAWKALIEEEFGDGIMSAIDFDTEIARLPHEKGDRVKITMTGQVLALQILRQRARHPGPRHQGRLRPRPPITYGWRGPRRRALLP